MRSLNTALLILAVWTVSCQLPPAPSEIRQAEEQEAILRGAGASVYFSQEYEKYLQSLRAARAALNRENLKIGWFRNYDRVKANFEQVILEGRLLSAELENFKISQRSDLNERADLLRERLRNLDLASISLIERGNARQELTRADVLLKEAEMSMAKEQYFEASDRLQRAASAISRAEDALLEYLKRFFDPGQIETWKRWAVETINESRKPNMTTIIVSKLERRLTVFKNGQPVKVYDIGLGFDGFSIKRFSGDNATPEGRYKIIKKNPKSQYYKALLIDYPNEEDKRRFELDKRLGRIPGWQSIGGGIEIHGGGHDILTRGCISLDDEKMDELFRMVSVGTPVTIIGTMDLDNSIVKVIKKK